MFEKWKNYGPHEFITIKREFDNKIQFEIDSQESSNNNVDNFRNNVTSPIMIHEEAEMQNTTVVYDIAASTVLGSHTSQKLT